MSICPKCGLTLRPGQETCTTCGPEKTAPLGDPQDNSDDGLDLVVTEANHQEYDLLGTGKAKEAGSPDKPVPEREMQLDDQGGDDADQVVKLGVSDPIGSSASALPPTIDEKFVSTNEESLGTTPPVNPDPNDNSQGLRRLSDTELQAVRRKMSGIGASASPNLKSITDIPTSENQPFSNNPIDPHQQKKESTRPDSQPRQDRPSPKMTPHNRGIALFDGNRIEITDVRTLSATDTLELNGRPYELRKKIINLSKWNVVAYAGIAAIVIFIGFVMLKGGDSDSGQISGIVLDRNSQPFVQGATIRFPLTGRSVTSDADGLFTSGPLPEGSHEVEYILAGQVVGSDYITVVGGKVSTIALAPTVETLPTPPVVRRSTQTGNVRSTPIERIIPSQENTVEKRPGQTQSQASVSDRKKSKKNSKTSTARLTLQANVKGAVLALDGKTIGAGNLTYSRLKPGKHKYVVSADGHRSDSGTISIKAGQTKILKVSLSPLSEAEKRAAYTAEDFYRSGMSALSAGRIADAIEDLNRSIDTEPGHARSYLIRAEAYEKNHDPETAHDDYIRAAEILRIQKKYGQANTAFSKAIGISKNSTSALLGRGELYLAKGEEIAALADFELARDIDKRNPRAHFGMGKARFQQGNFKKAIKHFKDARSLDSGNQMVHQYLMLSYLGRKDYKKVRKSFEDFAKNATQADMRRMKSDKKYSGVFTIIDRNN